ncbi:MAG: hypothetical protein IPN76_33515, partial [Saprospiraceae bacterium]|nr:hypothetical protein [Saprospiraceae bacterium]
LEQESITNANDIAQLEVICKAHQTEVEKLHEETSTLTSETQSNKETTDNYVKQVDAAYEDIQETLGSIKQALTDTKETAKTKTKPSSISKRNVVTTARKLAN